MCGLLGVIGSDASTVVNFNKFVSRTERRGSDASGLIYNDKSSLNVHKVNFGIKRLWRDAHHKALNSHSTIILGHSRLMTNGYEENQPVLCGDVAVLHNGIITNTDIMWQHLNKSPLMDLDTEVLAELANTHIKSNDDFDDFAKFLDTHIEGSVSTILLFKNLKKVMLYTNNGSLYLGEKNASKIIASEQATLHQLKVDNISQVAQYVIIDLADKIGELEWNSYPQPQNVNLIPQLTYNKREADQLIYHDYELKRCSHCILPETMPFISFNDNGLCNYCLNYKKRNQPKPIDELDKIVAKYRRVNGPECIIPFSGGRDSSLGLHLICKELGLRPITYTYDWGMVTDLARRNISKMCQVLNVENVLISADIKKKRDNIKMNLTTWLKKPDLGMVSILTAGDKHFFRWVETLKNELGIDLNIWSINPLETTHFKSGFLGIPPQFMNDNVYNSGVRTQFSYHRTRFKRMLTNPGYYNKSLIDTLSGEYYRSLMPKNDYYHLFDYWNWSETEVDTTLKTYDWEVAPDTNSTWRIGDGTAAFYNYVYYTMAGFTEHDTFRSNQIREGEITRSEALSLVEDENRPRFENIKWYLEVLGVDFLDAIKKINSCAHQTKG